MDGKTMLYALRHMLEEDSDSGFLDNYSSYRYINDAAFEFGLRTSCLKSTQSITTVASQAAYTLNADFVKLHMQNSSRNYIIKYYDGTSTYFIPWKAYEEIIIGNNTTAVTIPSHFTILDDATLDTLVTGSVTAAGSASGGQCTLTSTTSDFSDVSPHDIVHNTTDGSKGVVLSKTSATVLVTALFGGNSDAWAADECSGYDAFVIQPQGRMAIQFDPPPSTAAHTVTVYYIQRPAPVYSDYGVFRFPQQYAEALVKYAAWLYKYRDREPDYGDKWFMMFENAVRRYISQTNHNLHGKRFQVNLKPGRR